MTRPKLTDLRRMMPTAVLAAVLVVQSVLAPAAEAARVNRCEYLFIPATLPDGAKLYDFTPRDLPDDATLQSSLPPDLQILFEGLKPKLAKKFEKRFQKRDAVLAWNEAGRLVAAILLDGKATNTEFSSGILSKSRLDTLSNVLASRLDHTSAEVRMEQILLEIGYGEGTEVQQKWSDFRARYFRRLTFALRGAINLASTYALSIPLSNLKPYQKYQYFRPTRAQRHFWSVIEPVLREKIDNHHPAQLRELRIEIALKFVTRVMAGVVFALLLDQSLELIWPQWKVYKKMIGGGPLETRAKLEQLAYEQWKDIVEAFSGDRPHDQSPEAIEIRKRIDATPKRDLWLHVHEGGPLRDPAPKSTTPLQKNSVPPAFEADQTAPAPTQSP